MLLTVLAVWIICDIFASINTIIMMHGNKTNVWMRLACLVSIPIMALMVCCCSQSRNRQKVDEPAVEVVSFDEVEVKPTFNGGDINQFAQWIGSQVVYPAECVEAGIGGRVLVSFTVGTDGKLSDIQLLRGVHEKIDAEALRVVGMSPEWGPGIKDGKPVPVKVVFPLAFMLR